MSTLRQRILEGLAIATKTGSVVPPPPVEELDHGVLRVAHDWDTHHVLLHVRDEAVVVMHVQVRAPGTSRDRLPTPHESEVAAWLASITPAELGAASPAFPLAFVERAPLPALPFAGFAVEHPSATKYASTLTAADALLLPCASMVFPAHRCEIAREMEPDWAKTQCSHTHYSNWSRAPAAAARAVKYAAPKTAPKKRKLGRPIRPQDARGYVSYLRADASQWIELENWNRRVLRIAGRTATVLPTNTSLTLAGRTHAMALLAQFLEHDVVEEAPGEPDVLSNFIDQVETTAGDVALGVTPLLFTERATGQQIARGYERTEERVLTIEYELGDPRLGVDNVAALVLGSHMHVFANGFYRGKIDVLRLIDRSTGHTQDVAYPPPR